MPVHVSGAHDAFLGAIVGYHAPNDDAVCHVGLLPSDCAIAVPGMANIFHMGRWPQTESIPISIAGWLSALSGVQRNMILQWLNRQFARRKRQLYIAHPAIEYSKTPDPVSDGTNYVRFSCAGLVMACYEYAGIVLIVHHSALPDIDLATLRRLWPNEIGMANARTLDSVGLAQNARNAWPLVMPSYLFRAIVHAERHGISALPYAPGPEDWQYPRVL